MIDLTALLVCNNRKFNLDFCLNSINFCDPKPYTIVVDYGSVIPISYPEYANWCTVIRLEKPEKEFIKARAYNYGITFVKTKFICCTDIDEIFCKSFFGKIYDVLNKDKKRFVKCNTYWIEQLPDNINFNNINENYEYLIENYAKYCVDKAYFSKTGKKRNRGGDGCCHAMDLNILKDIGGYDEKFVNYGYSDTDLTIRCNYFMKWINLSNRISCIHLPHTYANNKECSYLVNEQTFKKNKEYYLYKKKNKLIYNENNSSFKCNTNKLQLQNNRFKKVQVNNNNNLKNKKRIKKRMQKGSLIF